MKNHSIKSLFILSVMSIFIVTAVTGVYAKPKLHIIFTTKYKDEHCTVEGGWCFQFGVWGDKIMQPYGQSTTFPEGREADVQVSDDGKYLYLNFTDRRSPYPLSVLEAQSDLLVPKEITQQLGMRSITILKGTYPVDRTDNPLGAIKLRISAK